MIYLRIYFLIFIVQIFLFITIKSDAFSNVKQKNKIYNSEKVSDYFSGQFP